MNGIEIDEVSLLVHAPGGVTLAAVEAALAPRGLSLRVAGGLEVGVADWLASGAAGAPEMDPADHLVAGISGRLHGGKRIEVRPAPRRAVGPDLICLFVSARSRFGEIESAWLRVHPRAARSGTGTGTFTGDEKVSDGEERLLSAIAGELRRG